MRVIRFRHEAAEFANYIWMACKFANLRNPRFELVFIDRRLGDVVQYELLFWKTRHDFAGSGKLLRKNQEIVSRTRNTRKTPRSFLRGVGDFRSTHAPTLARSSLFVTFWILNCSACIAGSARKLSLPK